MANGPENDGDGEEFGEDDIIYDEEIDAQMETLFNLEERYADLGEEDTNGIYDVEATIAEASQNLD